MEDVESSNLMLLLLLLVKEERRLGLRKEPLLLLLLVFSMDPRRGGRPGGRWRWSAGLLFILEAAAAAGLDKLREVVVVRDRGTSAASPHRETLAVEEAVEESPILLVVLLAMLGILCNPEDDKLAVEHRE